MAETAESLMDHALQLRDAGDLPLAIQVAQAAQATHPDDDRVLLVLASLCFLGGAYAQAAVAFRMLVERRPESERASLGLFHSLWHLGGLDAAFAEAMRFCALRESPEYMRIMKELDT